MKANRGKNSHKWEQQHRKQPNKKKKISIRTKSSTEEGEGNYGDCDYFNKLSDDVITSLFLRCTLKSLSRLRCTSKMWNNFIISPSFLHSHLIQSTENDPKLLFREKKRVHRRKLFRVRFVSVDMDGRKEELYTVTTPEQQFGFNSMQVCFGLVCLSTDCRLYLCNPALQQLCELPEYSVSATPGYYDFAFGYLHSRKEYKVVHFFYNVPSREKRWCYRGDLQLPHLKFEVLTINKVGGVSFNRWKEIADPSPCLPRYMGLVVNECVYWTTFCRPRACTNPVLSLDLENEKFLAISPPPLPFEGDIGFRLMNLKGLVCLPDADRFYRISILDLWILKDKISCSWVKEYSIRLSDIGFKEIMSGFRLCNEEIVFQNSGTIVFYDLKRKSFREVEALSPRFTPYEIYSKSLFSLGTNHIARS